MTIRVVHDDLNRYILTLDDAVKQAPSEAAKVVGRGSLNIKKGAQRRIRGRAHLPRYPYTINYDVREYRDRIEGEIGPDKSRGGQANLGAIIEFGSVNSPPIPHMAPATDDELPKFERAMEALAVSLLEGS